MSKSVLLSICTLLLVGLLSSVFFLSGESEKIDHVAQNTTQPISNPNGGQTSDSQPVNDINSSRLNHKEGEDNRSENVTPEEYLKSYQPGGLPPMTEAGVIEALVSQANDGDADVAQVLGRVLQLCDTELAALKKGVDYEYESSPFLSDQGLKVRRDLQNRCRPLLKTSDRYDPVDFFEMAAEGESPAALTWKALWSPDLKLEHRQDLAIRGAASGDPQALFDMADFIMTNKFGSPAPHEPSAWRIAACRSGYDCSSASIYVAQGCRAYADCWSGISLIEFLAEYELSPAVMRRALGTVPEIEQTIELGELRQYLNKRYHFDVDQKSGNGE